MSVVDFLFEGSAPTPGSSTATTTSQLPEWYNEYTRNMLGRAQSIADIPYSTYGGPRIAGFTPTEQAGMAATQTAAGAYKPFLSGAEAALGRAGGTSGLGSAMPFLQQSAGMSGAGAFQPFAGQAMPAITQAGQRSALSAAQPLFERALAESPISAAQPYAQAAMRTFPQAAAEYMNPYTEGVVNRISDLGVRQLQEKFLPEIGEEFTRAGQFGGSRMGEFGARALRDVQEAVLGEQAKALQSGYGQAAEIFGQDVGRAATLAGTLGQLGGAQQRAMLEAGAGIGKLSSDDISRLLESGVRLADIGRISGQLTVEDAARLANIGQTAGTVGGADISRLMDLAGRYGELGGAAQTMGLRGAQAVTGVGTAERGMQQQNLDLAYQDFLRQQGYPAEQAAFLSKMLSGVKLPEVNIQQTTSMPAQPGGPSGIEQFLGGATGIGEIFDLYNKYFGSSSTTPGPYGGSAIPYRGV
jgi:hypothetical protein